MLDDLIDFLLPLFEFYSNIQSIWEYAIVITIIVFLAFRIWSLRKKLESSENWSSKDRVRGLGFAIENKIPVSKIRIATSFLLSITGVLAILGAYITVTTGSIFDKALLFLSYLLWAFAGIFGLILSIYLTKFNRKLKKYHIKWVQENYQDFIDKARDFFVSYVLSRIQNDHENLLNPFVYLRVRDLHKNREHLGSYFYDRIRIDGVFPGEHTSLFFVPNDSQFELGLIDTVKNIYAAEHNFKEAKENEGIKKKLGEIENFKVEGLFKKLNYFTANLDSSVIEKKLSDINPTTSKWIIGSFESDIISKEVFYRDVASIVQRDDSIVLKFSNDEIEKIEASSSSRELDRKMIRQIENIIRSKKE